MVVVGLDVLDVVIMEDCSCMTFDKYGSLSGHLFLISLCEANDVIGLVVTVTMMVDGCFNPVKKRFSKNTHGLFTQSNTFPASSEVIVFLEYLI